MSFNVRKFLKSSLISLAALGMIGGSININAGAHRRYHYRYRTYRRVRRYYNRKGYWSRGRFYHYRTGYFHYGHWVKYRTGHFTVSGRWVRNRRHVAIRRVRKPIRAHRKSHHLVIKHVRKPVRTHRDVHHYHQPIIDFSSSGHNQDLNTNLNSNPNTNSLGNNENNNNSAPQNNQNNPAPQNNQNQSSVEQQIKQRTLADINSDREENGLSSVSESPLMDKISDMRAQQASANFTHYDASNNNTPYELEDANKLGIQFGKGAQTDSNGVTHYYIFTENLADNYGDNGQQVADNANNDMMYHDAGSSWGHRKNILYSPWRYVGIGVAPTSQSGYVGDYTIAEDFADWVK